MDRVTTKMLDDAGEQARKMLEHADFLEKNSERVLLYARNIRVEAENHVTDVQRQVLLPTSHPL